MNRKEMEKQEMRDKFEMDDLMLASSEMHTAERRTMKEKNKTEMIGHHDQLKERPRQSTVVKKQQNRTSGAFDKKVSTSSKQSYYSESAQAKDMGDQLLVQLEQQNEQLRNEHAYIQQQAAQKYEEIEFEK